MKGIPGLDNSPASLRAILTQWHVLALSVITTKDFDESWSDFQTAWLAAKIPFRATTVQAAFQIAGREPPRAIDGNAGLGVLAAMCKCLGEASGDGSFFLAVNTVVTLFSISKTTAWRWLKSLRFHRVIQLVSNGNLKDRQASTWLYIGEARS